MIFRLDWGCIDTMCIRTQVSQSAAVSPAKHTFYSHSISRPMPLSYARQSLLVASTKPTSVVSNSYSPMPARMVAAFKSQWLALRKLGYLFLGT